MDGYGTGAGRGWGSMDADQLSRLIQVIYAAAFETDGWPNLARLLAAQFDAESCVLSLGDWRAVDGDVRMSVAEAGGAGTFFLIGRLADISPGAVGMIEIRRSPAALPFGSEDGRVLRLLVPHVVRAVDLHRRFERVNREHRLTLGAFDACGIGVLAVRADGKLLFASGLAERKLARCKAVAAHHGQLHARTRTIDDQLARFIREAAEGRGDQVGVLPVEDDAGRAMSLLVCPSPDAVGPLGGEDPVALVFVTDQEDGSVIAPSILAKFYGLTPAEARLMAALLGGEHLDGYAARKGVSRETVRTLLKRIFGKTGHSRQADLIRSALGNPLLRIGSGQALAEIEAERSF